MIALSFAISTIALTTIVVTTIVMANQITSVKQDYNSKMKNIVDQVNNAQFYEYEFDKKHKAATVDLQNNVADVRNTYSSKADIAKGVETKELKADHVNIKAQDADNLRVNKINLGDKWQLSGTDEKDSWLKFYDKEGKDFYGGIAAANTWSRDNSFMNQAHMNTANANNSFVHGASWAANGYNVWNTNPGPLVEKRYAWDHAGDRYGVGQFPEGNTRVYTASTYPGKVSLSRANKDGTFDDVVTVHPNRWTTVNGSMNVKNNAQVEGDLLFTGKNNWIVHTPDDGRHAMFVAPSRTQGQQDWNWDNMLAVHGDGWTTGKNVEGRDHVRAGNNWQAWMRNDGNGQFTDTLSVGGAMHPDTLRAWGWKFGSQGGPNGSRFYAGNTGGWGMHVNTYNNDPNKYALDLHNNQTTLFNVRNDGMQIGINTNKADWGWRQFNANGGNIHMNHGNGLGIHVNTADQNVSKYSLELHNGVQPTYQVRNDGIHVGWGTNKNDWNWRQFNPNGGNVHMNHGAGYGMHINSGNKEGHKQALHVNNGERTLLDVFNNGEIRWKNANGSWTHFNYPDGKNYIRNDTQIDGNSTLNGNLHVNESLNIQKRLHFSDPSHLTSPNFATNSSDPYYFEKVRTDTNVNTLRLTINDDPQEAFEIWGNSCLNGNCGGPGAKQHRFGADGSAEHTGNLKASKLCINNTCLEETDIKRIKGV